MAWLLSLYMIYMIGVQTFGFDVGLAPGLSVKNAILYLLLALVLARYAINRDFKLELRGVYGGFAFLIGYALLSVAAVTLVAQYPGYKIMTAFIQLKQLVFDALVYFSVFFYGLRTRRDALLLLNVMLVIVVAVNVVSALDGVGVFQLDTINRGETDDRVQGIIGEHNQYGAYISLFIPPLIGAAAATRGLVRVFWVGGALASLAVLLMTVSRGAFAASALSAILGAYVFRRYLLRPVVLGWLAGGMAVAVCVMAVTVVTTDYGAVLVERLTTESSGADLTAITSGRTEIWADAIGHMMRSPLTLLTGFGWASYFVLPASLPLAPHNTYLWYWFELGLAGVIVFTGMLIQLILVASRAAVKADAQLRPHLIGFSVGAMALAVAIFFVELYTPWPYFWAYAGVVMRLVSISSKEQAVEKASVRTAAIGPENGDRFGWSALSPRG